jgi:hypothetical protein
MIDSNVAGSANASLLQLPTAFAQFFGTGMLMR